MLAVREPSSGRERDRCGAGRLPLQIHTICYCSSNRKIYKLAQEPIVGGGLTYLEAVRKGELVARSCNCNMPLNQWHLAIIILCLGTKMFKTTLITLLCGCNHVTTMLYLPYTEE